MFWGEQIGPESLRLLGMATTLDSPESQSQSSKSDYFVSRWFQGGSWGDYSFYGTPVRGIVDENKGADVEVGCIGCWKKLREEEKSLFEHEALSALLKELRHSGWVSLRLSTAAKGVLLGLECGVPSWGLYALCESLPEGLGGFFQDPLNTRMRESWVVSQILSTWPWPLLTSEIKRTQIKKPSEQAEKHIWLGNHKIFRDQIVIDSPGIVGVVTAWDHHPQAAWARTTRTCRGLGVRQSQWRSDGWRAVEQTWQKLDEAHGT